MGMYAAARRKAGGARSRAGTHSVRIERLEEHLHRVFGCGALPARGGEQALLQKIVGAHRSSLRRSSPPAMSKKRPAMGFGKLSFGSKAKKPRAFGEDAEVRRPPPGALMGGAPPATAAAGGAGRKEPAGRAYEEEEDPLSSAPPCSSLRRLDMSSSALDSEFFVTGRRVPRVLLRWW